MAKDDPRCRNCGDDIYYAANGWTSGGEWLHHRNDKAWCTPSLVGPDPKYAEPTTKEEKDVVE